ncbi:MAG: hypothetical protein V4436_02135 [Patescibacteria group bacterium]
MSTPTWQEEFDKKFKHVYHPKIRAENIIQDTSEIKSFITQLLTEQQEAVLRMIEEKSIYSAEVIIGLGENDKVVIAHDLTTALREMKN